jgi:hypothetical protein
LDVQTAKKKAALIREQGQQKYNMKLLRELEADKTRKLMVVNALCIFFLTLLGMFYLVSRKTKFDVFEQIFSLFD